MICDLFTFTCGNSIWTYTSSHDTVVVSPYTYVPLAIERGSIDVNQSKGECVVTMPFDSEPASLFAFFNPPGVLWVTITRYPAMHIIFVGKVVKCSPKITSGKSELKALAFQTVLAGNIPNDTFSTTCEHDLFDAHCGVAEPLHTVVLMSGGYSMPDMVTIEAIIFATYADGYFNGGLVQSGMEGSFVLSHVGDTLSLLYPLQTVAGQSYITVAPGCDKVLATCRNKYNSEITFGGCAFIPNVNISTQGW